MATRSINIERPPSEDETNSTTDREITEFVEYKDLESIAAFSETQSQRLGPDSIQANPEKPPALPAEGASQTVSAQDWNGPTDPDNPHNWSLLSRALHTVPPSVFAFSVTFGSSIYSPATADIMKEFNVSRTAAILGLSLNVVGLAFGPILAAPVSETFGRKVVYVTTLPIAMLFTLGAGYSQTFASLLVCRFFAGTFGSPILAVGVGTNADLFPPNMRAISTGIFLLAPFLGPSLGPVIGGFVAQYKTWRWTQWCMLFTFVAAYMTCLPMKETYKKIILARRAKRMGLDVRHTKPDFNSIVTVTMLRPLHMLYTEVIVLFLSLYTAFAFSVLFGFFAAFPYVFGGPPYHFTASQVGLTFLAIGLGVSLATISGIYLNKKLYMTQYRKALAEGRAHAAPEHRLYAAMLGSLGIPVGLFWFAWAADKGVHWACPVVAAIPFAWGNLCLFISTALYLLDVYGPLNSASALAANGILRYTLGAAFPLFTVQMYETLGTGWATSLLGFLSLAMLPIPWVLYRWGPKIRAKSHYPVII